MSAHRGEVLAAAAALAVKPLESGTRQTGLIIGRFAFREDLDAAWTAITRDELQSAGVVALASPGLPWEGWPGHVVPTIATVNAPLAEGRPTYMLVEGTGRDEERMDRYRDVILPMLRDRGAYYVQFELGGEVSVLAGEWAEGILAVSRWPSWASAEDFWYSDRYQTFAIPIRTGVGRFDVQIVEGWRAT